MFKLLKLKYDFFFLRLSVDELGLVEGVFDELVGVSKVFKKDL